MKAEEIQEKYPDIELGSQHLVAEERETIISWNDEDRDKIWIYSSQHPIHCLNASTRPTTSPIRFILALYLLKDIYQREL